MSDLTDAEQAVLRAITRAAKAGATCPSNSDLAFAARVKDARPILNRLKAAGIITVIGPIPNYRVIRIEATGEHTAPQPAPLYKKPTRLDELAEHIAEGASLKDAAWQMAITVDHAARILEHIRERLGRQAV